jgi:N-acetyl-anhydromuramyl-L-alanine amidase AmpD
MAIRGRIRVAPGRRTQLTSLCGLAVAIAAFAVPSTAGAVKPDYVNIVGNQSSRDGSRPSLIVLHTTTDPDGGRPHFRDKPGLKDLKRLGAWFDSPKSAVSSHVANDEQGHDARYVKDGRKAWTEVAFNSVGLSIEQIGTDAYSRGTWLNRRAAQLRNTAEWIAHWHRRWGIPISRAKVSGSTVVRPGVTTHAALGSAGGGHDDPGPGYPFGHVLVLARSLAAG